MRSGNIVSRDVWRRPLRPESRDLSRFFQCQCGEGKGGVSREARVGGGWRSLRAVRSGSKRLDDSEGNVECHVASVQAAVAQSSQKVTMVPLMPVSTSANAAQQASEQRCLDGGGGCDGWWTTTGFGCGGGPRCMNIFGERRRKIAARKNSRPVIAA